MSDVATMPKTEDKLKCEICGEMVTTHKGGRASHMRKHDKVDTPVQEAPVSSSVATGSNAEEKAIIASALAAQENYRKAPDVFMSEDSSDGNAGLVRMYAPECIDKFNQDGKLVEKAKRKPFFSSKENLARWASRGYVPVRGVNGAFVTNDGGDILTSCDRDNADAREARSQNESRAIVRSSAKDLDKMNVAGAEGSDNSDLRNTTLKVTQEETEV